MKNKVWIICALLGILLSLAPHHPQALAAPARQQSSTCSVPSIQYPTIAAALAAPACAHIQVAAGTYAENLTVSRSVTIKGTDAETTIVDGGGISSVFVITNSATVTLDGLTIQHGAGVLYGGGVYNFGGSLTLRSSVVYSNTADYGGGVYSINGSARIEDTVIEGNRSQWGGGIFNLNTLTIVDSEITQNEATEWGGGLFNLGGTVAVDNSTISYNAAPQAGGVQNEPDAAGSGYNAVMTIDSSQIISNTTTDKGGAGLTNVSHHNLTVTLTLNNSVVGYNVANGSSALTGTGGGIWNAGGSGGGASLLTINNSTISHNQAVNGGGIANAYLYATANHKLAVTINNSTISHNSTLAVTGDQVGNGGGLFNLNGVMTVTNSTLSGNAANGIPGDPAHVSGMGGGAINAGSTLPSLLTLTNTTIAGNHASVTGGALGTGLLNAAALGTATLLKSSIVAGNSATMLPASCTSLPAAMPSMFASQGYNLEDGNTCSLTQATDLIDTDPLLGALTDNGGRTQTHALLLGSPAIDGGHAGSLTADQRGRTRPVDLDNIVNAAGGDGSDIGAYELTRPPEPYLFQDTDPGSGHGYPTQFLQVGDLLFFRTLNATYGHELWVSDGTVTGTHMVKDINPGGDGLGYAKFIELGGVLHLAANDGVHGWELWRSDGTADGTYMVKDINPGSGSSLNQWDLYATVMGDLLFFAANDGAHGEELWQSDGTAEGTMLVKDLRPGGDSWPKELYVFDDTLFFSAYDPTYGRELWTSDGTITGTVMFQDIYAGGSNSNPQQFTEMNGVLFFSADDSDHWTELWRTDGTITGTYMVKDINPGSGGSFLFNLIALDGTLFFIADDGTHGVELWASDGTVTGTHMVKDINPGADSFPRGLTVANDTLFFSADDGTHGREMWRSDGTAGGTTLVRDLDAGSNDGLYEFGAHANVMDTLFFTANDGTHGWELWAMDAAAGGMALVWDILTADSATPYDFAYFGSTLFFDADDKGAHGRELWALTLHDLSLSKSVAPPADGVAYAGPVTYTLTLHNAGWMAESAAQIVDVLPDNVTFDRWVYRPSGATVDGHTIRWNGAVAGGDAITLTFVALNSGSYGSLIANTAHFTGSHQAGSAEASFMVTINLPPVADAGADQQVRAFSTGTLDGSASADLDSAGAPLSYAWQQTGGPTVALSGADTVTATFAAPAAPAVLTFTLAVTDAFGLSCLTSDEVVVTVYDDPPTLSDISAQSTTDGQALTFTITVDDVESGPDGLTLSGASSNEALAPASDITFGGSGGTRTVTITPTAGVTGTATITLTVSDGLNATSKSFVLTVNERPAWKVYLPLVLQGHPAAAAEPEAKRHQ